MGDQGTGISLIKAHEPQGAMRAAIAKGEGGRNGAQRHRALHGEVAATDVPITFLPI
jgi:hypothetical protein